MSLKSRFRNVAAAFLMVLSTVAPMGNGLLLNAYADEPTDAPKRSKTLTDNGDGTYTLTLSVTGRSSQSDDSTKANVVVIYDTSGSMKYPEPSTEYGRYGYNVSTNSMVQLYYCSNYNWQGNCNQMSQVGNSDNHDTVYYQNNYGQYQSYDGPRYSTTTITKTRSSVAASALKSLGNKLLDFNGKNGAANDMVEIAFIDFATTVNTSTTHTSPTTSKTTFSNWVDAAKPKDGINGGTNWEAALNAANNVNFQDNDTTYVIFVSDGNPTFRTTRHCSGWNCSDSDDNDDAPNGVHGSGNSDPQGWNLSDAQAVASTIVNAGKKLYSVGVFGDATNMQNLNSQAIYKDATDQEALEAAFDDIAQAITNSLSLTGLSFDDGITAMTSVDIEGTADGFTYTKNGDTWTNAPEAKYQNGKVTWDLGDTLLGDGETATVSFVVYPSQEALDLVADLNNGIEREYDESQIIKTPSGKYTLKTNTDYPTLTYQTVTTTTVNGVPTTTTSDPQTVTITNPDPVGLYTEEIELQKLWEDSLDPKQRAEEVGDIYLQLYVDGEEYSDLPNYTADGIKITNQEGDTWTSGNIFIAPGLMVSEGHPAYNEHAHNGVITMNGKKYAILNTGHEYKFGEKDINSHFELTNYIYHPMLVDGVLMNVTFTMDGDKIVGVESAKEMSTISATNTIKGGVNIEKKVVDENNNPVTDLTDQFSVKAHLKNPDGTDYSYDYRIYYGDNNPEKGVSHTCTDNEGNTSTETERSCHIYGTGTIDTKIYVGDQIRIVNMNAGTLFYVEEYDLSQGYELDGIKYQVSKGSNNNYQDYDKSTTLDGKTYYAVVGNAASAAIITNKYTSGTLKLSKTVKVDSGDEDNAKSKSFKFTVNLYTDNTKSKRLTGSYKYTGSKSGTIVSGGTVELKNGESIEIAKLPAGAYYEVTEEQVAGFATEKTGDTGTIVKNETSEAKFTNTYSVSGEVTIKAKKDLQGRDWLENEKFVFTLTGNGENQRKEVGKDEVAEFKVTINKDGSSTYTITEDITDLKGGLTRVTEKVDVIVTAADKGDGTLEFTLTYPDEKDEAIIVNTYKSSGTAQLEAGKILTGRDWMDNEQYTFSMIDEKGSVIDEQIVDANETVTFDEITYTNEDAGKTFVYIIRETSTLPNGMTKSGDIKATVEVTDNNDGTISTKVTYENGNTIINTYNASGDIQLEAAKELVGRNWLDGESYNFVLKDSTGKVLDTQTVDANETVKFEAIEYSEEDINKTFTYTISETGTLKPGLTKSGDITATVKVSDNGTGTLSTSVEYTNNDKIVNTYKATGSTNLEAKKVLEGREWQEEESYVFALIDSEGNIVERQVVDANETVSFKEFTYTEADAGKTYSYTISEISDMPGGLAKSADIEVTIEVVDNGDGTVTANVTYTQNDTITNTYSASGSVILEATKELTGRDWMENEQYTFALKDSEGKVIDEQIVNENETVSFDEISYTKAGTYTYTIEETSTLPDGVESSGPISVTVEVTDNFDGTLTAVAKYGENNDNTITNSYTAKGDIELKATKKLEGRKWLSGESFTFELFDESGKSLGTKTVTEGSPIATFEKIDYTEADIDKTYTYTIKEVSELTGGLSNSGDITVTVKITDNKNGSLNVAAEYTKNGTITNTYSASGNVTLEAEKELVGRDWLEGESYNFVLKDSEGTVIDTQAVNKNGKVSFKAINYDEADAGKTFTYTITETGELKPGLSKSGDLTVTVTVEDDGAGNLTATPKYTNGKKITNTYKASGDITLQAEKELVGRDWQDGESYNFVLKDSEGATVDTQTVDANETVSFKDLKFTEKDAGKTFTYTITETGELKPGLSKSGDITVTVTVEDNGDGTLKVTAEYTNDAKIVNTYKAEGKITLEAEKELVGRDWQDGESYNFVLKTADGEEIDTQVVNKNGKISFKDLEYTEADAGKTYNFIITEDGELMPGVTKSGDIEVAVTIEDNGDGTLKITAEYTNDAKIINTYKAKPAEHMPEAMKMLLGRDLKDNEFTFEVYLDGKLVMTGHNNADGTITFDGDPIVFDKPGTYTISIKEIKGDLKNITYDTTVFEYAVTVTDNNMGELEISTDEMAEDIVFVNKYVDGRGGKNPKTYDDILSSFALLLASISGLIGSIFLAKRKTKDEE